MSIKQWPRRKHDAHVTAWQRWQAELVRADSHVVHFRLVVRSRARRRAQAEAEGRTIRPYVRWHETKAERRRRERMERAIAEGRVWRPQPRGKHDAHVAAWEEWKRWQAKLMRADSHVVRFKQFKRAATAATKWHVVDKIRPTYKPKLHARRRKGRDELSSQYLLGLICASSNGRMRQSDVPPTLVEVKREHLKLKRLLKEMETRDE